MTAGPAAGGVTRAPGRSRRLETARRGGGAHGHRILDGVSPFAPGGAVSLLSFCRY